MYDAVKADIGKLKALVADMKLEQEENQYWAAAGGKEAEDKVNEPIVMLKKQEVALGAILKDVKLAHSIIKAQVPVPQHDPPILPKRLLDPDGVPYWPNKPPKPESDRGML